MFWRWVVILFLERLFSFYTARLLLQPVAWVGMREL